MAGNGDMARVELRLEVDGFCQWYIVTPFDLSTELWHSHTMQIFSDLEQYMCKATGTNEVRADGNCIVLHMDE